MILVTEFMDEAAVATLSAAQSTTYAPHLADNQSEIPALMSGVQVLVVRNRTTVNEALLGEAPDLRLVGRLGVGLDNIDLSACEVRGIEVAPVTGANTRSVAEYVVASAMVLLRGAFRANSMMTSGAWPRAACVGRETAGRVLGLIGFGTIAQKTAELAAGLSMKIVAYDPFLPADDAAWKGVQRMELGGVLGVADVVSLHVPLNSKTRHLISAGELAQMKSGAVLVNAARGGVVDDAALAASIRSGHLGGAALDVFETEPLTAETAAIFDGLSNLVLTPHVAGVTQDSNVRVSKMIADIILDRLGKT